ncbi:MAG: minor capsid protein [Clostridia bacterium]|nr:minor capsid protein [Clostridia bacterium]
MGFLDFIFEKAKKIEEAQKKVIEKSEEISEKVGAAQKTIETTPLDVIIKNQIEKKRAEPKKEPKKEPKPSRTAKIILSMFYSDYPEKPYISNERDKKWIEKAQLFPDTAIIPKSMMTRYENGLLPGHIYMLYWLKKYTNKKVPGYFEYKYGIDFEKEKTFLIDGGYLNERNKPTEKGESAIQEYYSVIESHKQPRPTQDVDDTEEITRAILDQKRSIVKSGFKEYEFIASRYSCEACAALNGKHFKIKDMKIGVNAPPMHSRCSCSICAYSDRDEYEKWLEHLAGGGTTAQWKKNKKGR